MSKKILITGAAGFIGFHAARALLRRGDHVWGCDNFNSYYDPALKQKRAEILKSERVIVEHLDICEKEGLVGLCKKHGITHILHLAAQAGVRFARKHPEAYVKSNIEGFLSVLETCRVFPHIKLVYASSSSVYGCNETIPFSESDRTDKPANIYAATKKANELMAYSYHHLYNIACTGLRYFTVYGPWGRPDMAYYSFSEALYAGKPITLFNEGKMQRDFTYIDDIVDGTLAAIDLEAELEVFNLGNHNPVPLLELVATLEGCIGKKAYLIYEGPSAGEVEKTFADISHSEKMLGYNPKTELKEGISAFIEWFLRSK